MAARPLKIGELAAASGLTPDALRYYERRGLLPPAHRTAGGFRQFDAGALGRIRFIKQAQAHGLTLNEIRELVRHEGTAGREGCQEVRNLLTRKLRELDVRRSELEQFRATLRQYLNLCTRALCRRGSTTCPVVEDLRGTSHRSSR